ncbi:MAG TPA: Fe-S cluster assembly protein SufD [Gemmatimonadales bacterium]
MTATYVREYQNFSQNGRSKTPWLAGLREAALERFQSSGFPSSREEDWRFVNLTPLTGRSFRLADANVSGVRPGDLAPFLYAVPGAATLVFVNGRYAPALSMPVERPAGVTVRNLAGAITRHADLLHQHLGRYAKVDDSGFTALNTAFVTDGLFLHVARGVDAGPPVHVVFVSDSRAEDAATYPRNFIVVEEGARAAVIESYVGLGEVCCFTNAVTEAVVGAGAAIEHIKIQRESERAYHVGTTHLQLGRDSRGFSHSVSFGAALGRNNLDVVLDGSGIEAQMLGLYMAGGRQEMDNHTSLLHAHPACSTREVYKGILDDHAHGVFNGKIYVTPLAQKTDAKQTNRALLLSEHARIDTKPQLEIYADDVKCTHGAAVGNLDQLAAFYLRSRGIGGSLARKILTYAFAAEVLEEIPYASVRASLEEVVTRRLEQPGSAR